MGLTRAILVLMRSRPRAVCARFGRGQSTQLVLLCTNQESQLIEHPRTLIAEAATLAPESDQGRLRHRRSGPYHGPGWRIAETVHARCAKPMNDTRRPVGAQIDSSLMVPRINANFRLLWWTRSEPRVAVSMVRVPGAARDDRPAVDRLSRLFFISSAGARAFLSAAVPQTDEWPAVAFDRAMAASLQQRCPAGRPRIRMRSRTAWIRYSQPRRCAQCGELSSVFPLPWKKGRKSL